jgi:hypothetical protein
MNHGWAGLPGSWLWVCLLMLTGLILATGVAFWLLGLRSRFPQLGDADQLQEESVPRTDSRDTADSPAAPTNIYIHPAH